MYAVLGLGNPGHEYEATRHNVGFWAADALASELSKSEGSTSAAFPAWAEKSGCLVFKSSPVEWADSDALLLIKPQRYMNLSGRAAVPHLNFLKIPPSRVLVIHDDLDIAPGKLKIKQGGSSGGHNGLKDLSANLGSDDYFRLRIGIGRPEQPERGSDISSWVLTRPRPEERELIENAVVSATKAVKVLIRDGLRTAQQQFNRV